MKKVVFHGPVKGDDIIEDINELKKIIMADPINYWEQGCGDGYVDIFHDGENVATLMLEPNKDWGMSLRHIKYLDESGIKRRNLLSLGNKDLLHEVVETADEIYVSKGLFIPHELAWEAIKDFIETEEPSDKITWITPDELPEGGNYA